MDVKNILSDLGINIPVIIAGIVGGFVSISDTENLTWKGKFTALIVGGAVANYATPFIVELVKLSDASTYGFAFFLGISGKAGAEWIITKLKDKYSKK